MKWVIAITVSLVVVIGVIYAARADEPSPAYTAVTPMEDSVAAAYLAKKGIVTNGQATNIGKVTAPASISPSGQKLVSLLTKNVTMGKARF